MGHRRDVVNDGDASVPQQDSPSTEEDLPRDTVGRLDTLFYQRGQVLDGSGAYRMRIPPGRPEALDWALTAYDVVDRSVPDVKALAPPLDGSTPLQTNPDGSLDVYLAPVRPAGAPMSNWIRTIAGRRVMAILRLHGRANDGEVSGQRWEPEELTRIDVPEPPPDEG